MEGGIGAAGVGATGGEVMAGDDVASDVDTGDSGSTTTYCRKGAGGGTSYESWHEELSSRVRNAIRKLEQPAMML